MTNPLNTAELQGLLARVEAGTADHQWALIRDAAKLLLDLDDLARSRINSLCDAGGFVDATLTLVERALPGWLREVHERNAGTTDRDWLGYVTDPNIRRGKCGWVGKAKTPALALLAALLKALLAQQGEG